MSKKERIRLFVGAFVMAVLFCAVAAIGWTKDEFTVTYFYGFDNKYETHTVSKGYVKEPPSSGRYGYIFDGWYYTDRWGKEVLFDFETERVTTDLELTAHWRPHETTVRLNLNGGNCEMSEVILAYGEAYTLPTPTKTGYYFAGWEGLSGYIFSSGVWTMPYADLVFTAKWSRLRPDSTLKLGRYEQDGDESNGAERIEWIMLDESGGYYLLVSKFIIDSVKLRENGKPSSGWENTDLREWLNSEFFDSVFSDEEKALISEFYDEKLKTTDKVFLLSEKESRLLVGDDIEGVPTAYAKAKGFNTGWITGFGDIPWLLRAKKPNACSRGAYGMANSSGSYGLRPAILIDAEKLAEMRTGD